MAAKYPVKLCLTGFYDQNGKWVESPVTRPKVGDEVAFERFLAGTDNIKKSSEGGRDPVNPAEYLNIWVGPIGRLIEGEVVRLNGYSALPGGAPLDGIAIDYQTFQDANMNSGVHELGHYLNLIHTWGDKPCGDDMVDDTPVQRTSLREKSTITFPHNPNDCAQNQNNGEVDFGSE